MTTTETEPLRLHIGGTQVKPGWKILNVQPGEGVDFVGSCTDLSQFDDASVQEVYASHVLEHLGYQAELPQCLAEIHRVLTPEGKLLVSVPNLEVLCKLFVAEQLDYQQRFYIMRIIMGGQIDDFDFHKVGFTFEILTRFAGAAGFQRAQRVKEFNLFEDTSTLVVYGNPISLNVILYKS